MRSIIYKCKKAVIVKIGRAPYNSRLLPRKGIKRFKMEDENKAVRFSLHQNTAQIDIISGYKKEDGVKNFKEMELGRFYIVILILSIVTFILDLYFHCWLAYVYYRERETSFFALTLFFIVVPALISSAFSMRW